MKKEIKNQMKDITIYWVHYNTNLIKDIIIDQPLVNSVVITIERSCDHLTLKLTPKLDVTGGKKKKLLHGLL
jgi:hypothetical protein